MFQVSGDILDSRDVIDRLEELQAELDDLESSVEELQESLDNHIASLEDDDLESPVFSEELKAAEEALANWSDEYGDELKALKELDDEFSDIGDWRHGETLIADRIFTSWCEEFANDIGAINSSMGWPLTCIDWDKAARELQYDYTYTTYDGIQYWIRNS